jgi:hypothetical protein
MGVIIMASMATTATMDMGADMAEVDITPMDMAMANMAIM